MSKKIFIFIVIVIILILSIIFGFIISKQIKTVHTSNNEIANHIEQEKNIANEEKQETITFINYLDDKNNPIEYLITDQEKIQQIKDYISKIGWTETDEKGKECFWKIEIKGKEPITLLMHGEYHNTGLVTIQQKGTDTTYKISKTNYSELIGFSSKKYYLHKSNLEKPAKEICEIAQKKALEGLNEFEIKELQKTLRETHMMMEHMLLDAVRLIKEPNSPYWKEFTIDEIFTDPYSGVLVETYGFFDTMNELKKIENMIKETETKEKIKDIYTNLQVSTDKHDLEGCFKAHEKIHDYDYWIINYPAYFEKMAPVDWGGIDTYFGNIK